MMFGRKQILSITGIAVLISPSLGFAVPPVPRPQTNASVGNALSSPIYVNLYWDAMWDADNKATPEAALDSFTAAMLSSSYFGRLAEYGVGAPTYGGGFKPDPSCVQKAPSMVGFYDPVKPSIIGFLNCELLATSSNPLFVIPKGPQVIYNVILPSGSLESDFFGNFNFCGGGPAAWHFHQTPYSANAVAAIGLGLLGAYTGGIPGALEAFLGGLTALQGGPIYTIESADPMCGTLTNNLLHEMVEAASDPFPPPSVILTGRGEIGDLCESAPPSTPFVPPQSPFSSSGTFTTAAIISVPQYWSNAAQTCLSGFTDTTIPDPGPLVSNDFLNFTIAGQRFGTLPSLTTSGVCPMFVCGVPGFPATGFAALPYIEILNDETNQQQGNSLNAGPSPFPGLFLFPGNPIGLTSWTDTSISGSFTDVGSFSFWVCNPASGRCARGVMEPPLIASVDPSTLECGTSTPVTIKGHNFYNVTNVTLDTRRLNFTVDSLSQIRATIPNSIGGGSHVITVNTSHGPSVSQFNNPQANLLFVPPRIASISPSSGPAAGGTPVTVSGGCLNSPTFFFGSTRANYVGLLTGGMAAISPPATVGAMVDVVASVGSPGVPSTKTQADQFTYTAPSITSVSPNFGPATGGTQVTLTGTGFSVPNMQVSFVGPGGASANIQANCFLTTSPNITTPSTSCNVLSPPVPSALPLPIDADIIVTAFGGSSNRSASDVFTYKTQYPTLTSLVWYVTEFVAQLNGNVPPGAVITVQSSDPSVVVPPSVSASGTSARIPVSFLPTPTSKTVTVTATYLNSSASKNVPVPASPPLSIVPDSGTLANTQSTNVTITVNTPPAGNAVVTLSSTASSAFPGGPPTPLPGAVSIPGTVTILAGKYSATFTVTSHYAGNFAKATLTATYNTGSNTASASTVLFLTNRKPKPLPSPRQ